MTLGVHDAINALNLEIGNKFKNFKIIGFDGFDSVKRLIDMKDKFIIGCVYHNYERYAEQIAKAAKDMLNNKTSGYHDGDLIKPSYYYKQ